ncbi:MULTISPECIES: hypothetical protein [Corynebacterium]|uniref:hypothetical protein n=1 Tax=Corynebacterium TaxID=1716 RepID=UPI00124E85E7|nr:MULTISPECIES: hypothetical protein [Corynebacterium]
MTPAELARGLERRAEKIDDSTTRGWLDNAAEAVKRLNAKNHALAAEIRRLRADIDTIHQLTERNAQ